MADFSPIGLCPICRDSAAPFKIKVRSGKDLTLWCCDSCDYNFFLHDPTLSLAANKLDDSRLKASGLNIPNLDEDFANGLKQSEKYIDEFLAEVDKGKNILEVGCSWGYFLKLVSDAGGYPFGIEINSLRAAYVNNELKIPCFSDIESCESSEINFHRIFLFYVLEYIPQPSSYLQRLINMLEEGGSLIIVTPNLNDVLKDLYCNSGYINFFYDEHAINYFSVKAVEQILKQLNIGGYNITTRQGYSFINHINWFLTNSPRTTNVVGGDNYIRDFVKTLHSEDSRCIPYWNEKHFAMSAEIENIIKDFDKKYREIIEKNQYGNQIWITIYK